MDHAELLLLEVIRVRVFMKQSMRCTVNVQRVLIMMENVRCKASEAVRTVISSVSLVTLLKKFDHWECHCSAAVIYIQCLKLEQHL
jgi:hypothetical protein